MATQTQYRDVKTAVATVFQSISPEQAIFRKEGEYWTVGYGGKAFRLKDTKGLGYLAHLLRHPAAEFHVLDLAGGIAGQREEDETSQSVHGLPRGERGSRKGRDPYRAVWVTRARCSTSRPRSLIDAGSPSCAKNWKKPRSSETSSAPSRRNRRSMR